MTNVKRHTMTPTPSEVSEVDFSKPETVINEARKMLDETAETLKSELSDHADRIRTGVTDASDNVDMAIMRNPKVAVAGALGLGLLAGALLAARR